MASYGKLLEDLSVLKLLGEGSPKFSQHMSASSGTPICNCIPSCLGACWAVPGCGCSCGELRERNAAWT